MPDNLTTAEAAAAAGVCQQRILALLAQHRIPGATKHSGVWLIPVGFKVLPPATRKSRALSKIDAALQQSAAEAAARERERQRIAKVIERLKRD